MDIWTPTSVLWAFVDGCQGVRSGLQTRALTRKWIKLPDLSLYIPPGTKQRHAAHNLTILRKVHSLTKVQHAMTATAQRSSTKRATCRNTSTKAAVVCAPCCHHLQNIPRKSLHDRHIHTHMNQISLLETPGWHDPSCQRHAEEILTSSNS